MHWRKAMCASKPDRRKDAVRDRPRRLHLHLCVNGVGAAATGMALAVILAAKFTEGAWITVLAIPALLVLFRSVHRHYAKLDAQVQCAGRWT